MKPQGRSTLTRTETAVARVRATMSETRRRQERDGRFTGTAGASTTLPTRVRKGQWMTPEAASTITSAPRPTR